MNLRQTIKKAGLTSIILAGLAFPFESISAEENSEFYPPLTVEQSGTITRKDNLTKYLFYSGMGLGMASIIVGAAYLLREYAQSPTSK